MLQPRATRRAPAAPDTCNWVARFATWAAALTLAGQFALATQPPPAPPLPGAAVAPAASIPVDQLGAAAGRQYQGDGLAIVSGPDGTRLRCVLQRMEGLVTAEGLWLTSTAESARGERFRVRATGLGRETGPRQPLPAQGTVEATAQLARYLRPGLTEEYSVSVDGVRQDFVVATRPPGEGSLRVELSVHGATATALPDGAELVLDGSGRRLSYNRLRVSDAHGKELTARLETTGPTAGLAIVVDDAEAAYPVQIDPTFSDANWVSLGGVPGANHPVWAMTFDAAGNLYIGGDFTAVGNTLAKGVAKWDGTTWSALGEGAETRDQFGETQGVRALAILGDELYVGGTFRHAGGAERPGLARWKLNGGGWSDGGLVGDTHQVHALLVINNEMYIAGLFRLVANTPYVMLAKGSGVTWSPMAGGAGVGNWGARALATTQGKLFVGGSFIEIAGVPAANIADWTIGPNIGTGWSALGDGVGGSVQTLATFGSDVYVGGDFIIGDTISDNAKWSVVERSWSRLPAPPDPVRDDATSSMLVVGEDLFVGSNSGKLRKWSIGSSDATGWTLLGNGLSGEGGPVRALAVSGNSLYVGGQFQTAGLHCVRNLARWTLGGAENNNNWSPLPHGPTGFNGYRWSTPAIRAMIFFNGDLYVGGNFLSVAGMPITNIAKWNGTTWSSVGGGLGIGNEDIRVQAMAVSGNRLFVGANGLEGVLEWDGTRFTRLTPFRGANTLQAVGDDLFVGDDSGLHRYSISQRTAFEVGGNVNGQVYALTVSGNDLYVGGSFTSAGGVAGRNNIAKWRIGSSGPEGWSGLGSGVGGTVWSLVAAGDQLYVGGDFTTIAGATRNNIARWTLGGTDDNSWAGLGSGVGGAGGVRAMTVVGNELFVGGYFTAAGGQTGRYRLAKWVLGGTGNSSWGSVGTGVSEGDGGSSEHPAYSGVHALAAAPNGDLFVGGIFTIAGDKPASHLAKVIPPSEPPTVSLSAPALAAVGRPVLIQATASDPDGSVAKVEFFAGTTKLGEDLAEPFEHFTTALGLGEHVLTAVATDNRGLTATSAPVRITLLLPPSITIEPPLTAEFNAFTSGDFGVVAAGSEPLSYQWLLNGNPLPDATTATMSFVNIRLDQAGDYRVVVSNPVGSVTSRVVKVTVVLVPPSIVQQPRGGFVGPGDRFLFSVIPQGTPPFTFQWQLRRTNLPGATGQDLILSNATVQDAGAYRVIVSNAAGSLASDPAHLAYFGDLQLIASLVLAGEVGQTVRVEFSDALAPGAGDWLVLTNLTLPHSPFLVIDPTSRNKPKRYYRAVKP